MRRLENIIGQKYGRLTISYEIEKRWEKRRFSCVCDCWSITNVSLNNLRTWEVLSCWCIKKEMLVDSKYLHWMSKSKIYYVRWSMVGRCTNHKNKKYKDYWWRWIKCERNSFEEFYKDMYESYTLHNNKYGWRNTSIERIDVNWNYCKYNCKRVTFIEQQRNKTTNYKIDWKCISEIASDLWISKNALWYRMNKLWMTPEQAINYIPKKNQYSI